MNRGQTHSNKVSLPSTKSAENSTPLMPNRFFAFYLDVIGGLNWHLRGGQSAETICPVTRHCSSEWGRQTS